jgi:hypothetical protein
MFYRALAHVFLMPVAVCLLFGLQEARAEDLATIGRVTLPKSSATLAEGTKEAKRKALNAAIDKVMGSKASSNPAVLEAYDRMLEQISDSSWSSVSVKDDGSGAVEISIVLTMDEKEFRTLLSDLGVSLLTANVRSFAILAIFDEFVSRPGDPSLPEEVVREFSSERLASYSDQSSGSASSRSSSATSSSGSVSGHGSWGGVRGGAQSSDRSSSSDRAQFKNDVEASAEERVSYKEIIKYQPKNSPETSSVVYSALSAEFQDRDLRVLDNDMFRSKHFKDQPLTLEQMSKSEALATYVGFARQEAAADFFLVGNSIIFNTGESKATGNKVCTALVSVKTYSTSTGESIASDTLTETGSGGTFEECKGNLGKKVGSLLGPMIATRVQDYWKRRQMYGTEYSVFLLGPDLGVSTRMQFLNVVKNTADVVNVSKRNESSQQVELTVTYKGAEAVDDSLAMAMLSSPAFQIPFDKVVSGKKVFICIGKCHDFSEITGVAPPAPAPQMRKKK